MINSFCGLFRYNYVIGSILESSFFLVAVSVILASITPFQLKLTAATLASSTNQLNATVGPTPPSMKLFQNSTNSSLVVEDINTTNLTQKQGLIDQPNGIQTQQQLPLSQSQPQPLQEQTVPLPEFKPKPRENIQGSSDQFSMTVQFQPYPYGFGWYQVSDWQLALSYPNRWCPSQNCTFQLSLGYLGPGESSRGGGTLFWNARDK
jgi:hypothetical protein